MCFCVYVYVHVLCMYMPKNKCANVGRLSDHFGIFISELGTEDILA